MKDHTRPRMMRLWVAWWPHLDLDSQTHQTTTTIMEHRTDCQTQSKPPHRIKTPNIHAHSFFPADRCILWLASPILRKRSLCVPLLWYSRSSTDFGSANKASLPCVGPFFNWKETRDRTSESCWCASLFVCDFSGWANLAQFQLFIVGIGDWNSRDSWHDLIRLDQSGLTPSTACLVSATGQSEREIKWNHSSLAFVVIKPPEHLAVSAMLPRQLGKPPSTPPSTNSFNTGYTW